ncbi:ADP-ribosyl cyclase/cyclic ADP-ribose hydrolase 2 isoform X2 [Heterocephalus glaber]|uniref:ADP-ribosyl cyclase/cyclic ADP-ribose hydrolase n=1 Tax=Heterocephalus glaber TaxID=10181 RepID=A0AAX6T3J0_HETGA|nr:ADP-ribosyl cyclase/cyclic ADP-ribose hydrolase 2 isoform X2 [Heterocephalus glaber]
MRKTPELLLHLRNEDGALGLLRSCHMGCRGEGRKAAPDRSGPESNKKQDIPGDKNCTAIWEAFRVVLDKDPCSVLPSDYDLFINLSRHPIPRDKSLFWENNHLLVAGYSENTRRFMPLCDVLYGRVGDFLSWCRQKNASGLDYQSCPTSEDCENNAVDSYWKRASMQYSRDSSGVIYVMLNGSEPKGAYPIKGFFADFEIPYLQKDKVTQIEIWVMHEIGGPNVESCGEGSVKILEDRLEALGFRHSCVNDHTPVKLLMCVDHSTHPDCAFASSAMAAAERGAPPRSTAHSSTLLAALLVALASGSQM